ncbi:ribokinase [Glutamicibacter endophyticus]
MTAQIVLCGPASWNQLIVLDRLPEPTPHTQFAEEAWKTIGGTSAGKALHLTSLGLPVTLHTALANDEPSNSIQRVLSTAGVSLTPVASERTEQHVNLMTRGGERVSLYVATPSSPSEAAVAQTAAALREADVAVIDLCELGARVLAQTPLRGIWTDLHDYDGASTFHEPFLRAAEVVFMNDDRTEDAFQLMSTVLAAGARLAVCTQGKQGAVAMNRSGERFRIAAPQATVRDTNGAGDAFMAGFLAASLAGDTVQQALESAAEQARIAVESPHLHPVVEAALGA